MRYIELFLHLYYVNQLGRCFILLLRLNILLFHVCKRLKMFYIINKISLIYFRMGTTVSIIVQFINCAIIFYTNFRIVVFIAIPSLITSRLRALILVIIFMWAIQVYFLFETTKYLNLI